MTIKPFTDDCLHPDSPLKDVASIKMLAAMGVPLQWRYGDGPKMWFPARAEWFTDPDSRWPLTYEPLFLRRAP